MSNHSINEDEIGTELEKALERSQEVPLIQVQKVPDAQPVSKTLITNFTCTGCGEVLPEVIALNGYVQGECGRSHTKVKVKI